MRMNRRAGLLSGASNIGSFWANANILGIDSRSASTAASRNVTIGSTETPVWTFLSTGKAVEIAKYSNNEKTVLKYVKMSVSDTDASDSVSTSSTTSSTKVKVDARYAYVFIWFKNPTFSESATDALLSDMTFSILNGRYSTSNGTLGVASSEIISDRWYIQTLDSESNEDPCWSICAGNNVNTAIKRIAGTSTGIIPFWDTISSTYRLSRTGDSSASSRAGNICELY